MTRGKLIVMEGLDRAGKSTQCSLLASSLRNEGHDVVEMKFPDRTTKIGQMINEYLTSHSQENSLSDEAIHLLFSANRWELAPVVEGHLNSGKSLVVDRYTYSGIAFSSAKGLDREWCKSSDAGLPRPDLVVFLDVDEEMASKRGGYGNERYETLAMQRKVREEFLQLKEDNWKWILASGTVAEVSREILDAVHKIYM